MSITRNLKFIQNNNFVNFLKNLLWLPPKQVEEVVVHEVRKMFLMY
jgi:hypothetical protein